MKKLILLIVLLLTISTTPNKIFANTQQIAQPSAKLSAAENNTKSSDLRVVALENIFAKYNSPLQGQAEHYVHYADKYDIDWKLLPAISGLESTFAQFMIPNSHNAYGWGGGYIDFNSWEHGIDVISKSLKTNYYDRGADTIPKIGPIYAEATHWSATVTRFSDEINREYVRLQSQNLSISI